MAQDKIKSRDDMLRAITASSCLKEQRWSNFNSRYASVMKDVEQYERRPTVAPVKNKRSVWTASQMRKDMVSKGNGNIIAGGFSNQTGETLYKQSFSVTRPKTSMSKSGSSNYMDMTQSLSYGVVMPDPFVLNRIHKRAEEFQL